MPVQTSEEWLGVCKGDCLVLKSIHRMGSGNMNPLVKMTSIYRKGMHCWIWFRHRHISTTLENMGKMKETQSRSLMRYARQTSRSQRCCRLGFLRSLYLMFPSQYESLLFVSTVYLSQYLIGREGTYQSAHHIVESYSIGNQSN